MAAALLIGFSASADIDFASLDTSSLQLVSRDRVPSIGTFWIEIATGIAAPLPCPPGDYPDAPIYALPNGQFLVDVRNCERVEEPSMLMTSGSSGGGGADGPTPMDVSSNAWFSQIIVSNQPYLSLDAVVVDENGIIRNFEFPVGIMFPVTSPNVSAPLSQWQPVGQTNSIGNYTFFLPYNAAGNAKSFYRICAQLAPDFDPTTVGPYSLIATNLRILTDQSVALTWTNTQPGQSNELEAIVVTDARGHAYLIDSVVTSGASGSFLFDIGTLNGLTVVRYTANADTPADLFFLSTNYFVNPDVITVPYVIIPDAWRDAIMRVAVYDVTDSANPRLLAENTGNDSRQGTLEIPGMVLGQGNRILSFQVTDTGYYTTTTNISITVASLVSITYPILHIENDGSHRVYVATAGDGIAIEATTSATNGTWYITAYDGPSGTQLQRVQVPVASTGGTLIYDDGGEPPGGYTNQWFYYAVTIGPPTPDGPQPLIGRPNNPPTVPLTNRFKFWLSHPRQPAGEITCYDAAVLPSNTGDRNFALQVMQGAVATMFSFTCFPVDFPQGVWTVDNGGGSPPISSLRQPFAWTAMQASLARKKYDAGFGTNKTAQTPTLPINNFFIMGEGGVNDAGVATEVQGKDTYADNPLNESSLKDFGFTKTNALALAVFMSCRVGDGPLMKYVLRNNDIGGQIDSTTRTSKHVRWCFGLGWNQDKSRDWQIYDFVSWWAFHAGVNNYSFDRAVTEAQSSTAGNGGNGVVWSGCSGMTISRTVP